MARKARKPPAPTASVAVAGTPLQPSSPAQQPPPPLPPPPTPPACNTVTRHNLDALLPAVRTDLAGAAFVAVDCEFSGLGSKNLFAQLCTDHSAPHGAIYRDLRDRYTDLRAVATSHSLCSLGLSIFRRIDADPSSSSAELPEAGLSASTPLTPQPVRYATSNYSFLLLSSREYSVSPRSLSFLVDNGFDFNAQIRDGIPYRPGTIPDPPSLPKDPNPDPSPTTKLRALFAQLLSVPVPIVVHNGLLDLLFLYQSFHADLPGSLDVFVADAADMFAPAGVFDTKYVADYVDREKASYLAYLYRK
ncbi:Target of EGR1, member 1 (Nuclear), partial [Cladochytrium tenue]